MSRHTTYRGLTIDMDTMRRENEKTVALGNMGVNAKGDKLGKNGTIAKTADQLARENHRVQTAVINTGLKGDMPAAPESPVAQKPTATAAPAKAPTKKTREKELPSGDIVIEDSNEEGN